MSRLNQVALNKLTRQCNHCLQHTPDAECRACRELLRRALRQANDGAWDASVPLLWPTILRWIYAARPDLAPGAAARIAHRALRRFRAEYPFSEHPPVEHREHFPRFADLMGDLQRCVQDECSLL
jgi:hypothetical protein